MGRRKPNIAIYIYYIYIKPIINEEEAKQNESVNHDGLLKQQKV